MKEIDAQRVDGHFLNASGQIPAGDEEVSELLRRILMWAEIVLERYFNVDHVETPQFDI